MNRKHLACLALAISLGAPLFLNAGAPKAKGPTHHVHHRERAEVKEEREDVFRDRTFPPVAVKAPKVEAGQDLLKKSDAEKEAFGGPVGTGQAPINVLG